MGVPVVSNLLEQAKKNWQEIQISNTKLDILIEEIQTLNKNIEKLVEKENKKSSNK